jgi:response regulator RpfG family c-di-GMP phosphodiesterase
MQSSRLFKRLKQQSETDPTVRFLMSLVEEVHDDSVSLAKTVIRHFPEYTLHDEVHIRKVIKIMGELIPENTLRNLSPLEVGALLLAAALHDIGMAPTQLLINSLRSGSDELDFREEVAQYNAHKNGFSRYY